MALDLLSGLTQGFAQAQQLALERAKGEELKKIQVKLFKRQLEENEKAGQAKEKLLNLLSGGQPQAFQDPAGAMFADQAGTPGFEDFQPQPPGLSGPGTPMSMADILKSPEGQGAALRSGFFKGGDLLKPKKSLAEMISEIEAMRAGGAPGVGGQPSGGPAGIGPASPGVGPGPGASRYAPPEFSIDEDGNLKATIKPNKVSWKDTGGEFVAVDDFGGRVKVPSIKKTLGASDLKLFVDKSGKNPKPGATLADVAGGGYEIKEDRIDSAEATRVNLANVGASQLTEIKNIIAPGGKIDKGVLLQMEAPMGGIGRGREVNQMAYPAVAGLILSISGVAVRPEEREQVMEAYIPSLLDLTNKDLADRKINRLQSLIEGNLDSQTLPPSLRKRIDARRKDSGVAPSGLPQGSVKIGTSNGKPVYQAPDGKKYIVEQ